MRDKIVQESKKADEEDLRPYISPKDVQMEIIDKSNTARRWITQLKREDSVYNKTIYPENIGRVVLSIKFINTGRLEGYIEIEEIITPHGMDEGWNENKLIIPGVSDSGWLLGIQMKEDMEKNDFVYYDYRLLNYSEELNFNRELKFSVKCDFRSTDKVLDNPRCSLEEYKNHYNE